MKTLGIVIPVHRPHLQYLPRLLKSLANNTILPDMVSISCSSISPDLTILLEIIQTDYPYQITWQYTTKYLNAAQNRNIAAQVLNTDIISMIDADDLSHHQRNEIIIQAFNIPNVQAVLHDYHKTTTDFYHITEPITDPDIYPNYLDIITTEVTNQLHIPHPSPSNPISGMLHPAQFGHISITKQIHNQYQLDEAPNYAGREDAWYVHELVKHGIPITYINNQLTIYDRK